MGLGGFEVYRFLSQSPKAHTLRSRGLGFMKCTGLGLRYGVWGLGLAGRSLGSGLQFRGVRFRVQGLGCKHRRSYFRKLQRLFFSYPEMMNHVPIPRALRLYTRISKIRVTLRESLQ